MEWELEENIQKVRNRVAFLTHGCDWQQHHVFATASMVWVEVMK